MKQKMFYGESPRKRTTALIAALPFQHILQIIKLWKETIKKLPEL
jgi:hypothetical protein